MGVDGRPHLNSFRAADREALQRAARILLRDGLTAASEALNATIEAWYPSPPSRENSYSFSACTFSTCPCPFRCQPLGCIQQPRTEQLGLQVSDG